MNRKGFTLIEVICVIVVLSLVALIVYPKIRSVIIENRNKLYDKNVAEIIRVTDTYVTENPISSVTSCIPLSTLYTSGYIKNEELENPKTGEPLKGYITITWNSTSNRYDYVFVENSTGACEP